MAEYAHINPKVLAWARRTARMSETDAAAKASVKVEKYRSWEEGTSHPTIRQAKLLAKAFQRPFALLFLPDIPIDFQPLQDFRKPGSRDLSTAMVFMIREIQQKQSWISEENQETDEPPRSFVGKFTVEDDPKIIAQDILDTLGIDPLSYEDGNPLREWIKKSEKKGIYISRTSFIHSYLKLDKEEFQGFAIADPYAPFVFINSADWDAPQLFTLVHELAHLWIASSGISNEISPDIVDREKYHPVELLCNEIAANALMKESFIMSLSDSVFHNAESVYKVAKKLGVSSFALLVRARNLGKLTWPQYQELRKQADQLFHEFLDKEELKKKNQKKKGGPSYYTLRLIRNGQLFTQSVLDAFNSGRLSPTEASYLLKVKTNQFPKLEEKMYS